MRIIKHVSIEVLSEVLEIIYHFQRNNYSPITIKEILKHCSRSEGYIRNTLSVLKELKLLESSIDSFKIPSEHFNNIYSPESVKSLIESIIRRYSPFVEFLYLISIGKPKESASKMVKDIFKIDSSEDMIYKAFSAWVNGLKINISEINPPKAIVLEQQYRFEEKTEAILFIREQFGDDITKIQKDIFEDLVEALMDFKNDPEKTVNDAGRALEDFLRYCCKGKTDVSGCSGIIQIANVLNRPEISISSKKHNGILIGLGNIRSMGDAHGIDKSEEQRWTVKEDTALLYVSLIIKVMKSIIEYQKGKLII